VSAITRRLQGVSLTERQLAGEPTGRAGDLLQLLELFDAGLEVTTEGALVWVVRIEPRNWTLLSALERGQLSLAMAELARQPQSGEVLQFVVESTPVDWERLLAATRSEVEAIAGEQPSSGREAASEDARARWLLYGAMEHSVSAQARTAMATDCYMIVPYTRHGSSLRGRLAQLQAGGLPAGPLRMGLDEIEQAIAESREYVEDLCEILERAGMRTQIASGEEVLDRHWRRFNPTSAASEPACPYGAEILGSLRPREELEDAKHAAHQLRDRIARSHLDFAADARVVEIEDDLLAHWFVKGELRSVSVGWLYESVRSLGLPWTLSMYVHGLDRKLERAKLKARQNKDHGLEAEALRRGQPTNIDRRLRLSETEELIAKMGSEQRTVLGEMSVYGSVRYPGPVADAGRAKAELKRAIRKVRESVRERAEATVADGYYIQRELFDSSQPLGRDVAKKTKKYTNEVIGATLVPPGTRLGSESGPPFLLSLPGRTVERINPFDRRHENLIAILTGAAGSGKTMLANALIGRTLAAGMNWFVLDRAGHYRLLCEVIGGQHIDLGADGCPYAINPWDVEDPRVISGQKVQRLLALHRLLIGERRQLAPQEIGQLEAAIRHAYALAADHDENPRESHLLTALARRAEQEDERGASETGAQLRNLIERLGPFCRGGVCGEREAPDGGGAYAYLLDRETTVPEGSPMVVFDTRQVDEAIMPAVAFSLIETVRTLAERHFDRLALQAPPSESSGRDGMRLAGRLGMAMDEMWSLLLHEDTASHIADLGKRHRHWALFTLVISQQLRDFSSKHGRAFLDNSSMKFLGKQRNDLEVQEACELFQLSGGERDGLAALQMQQDARRKDSRWLWLNGAIGRGICLLALSSLEYWAYTSDAREDVPLRRRKIAEHGGDTWRALLDLAQNHPRGLEARR
jgi:hypothetical protein